MRKFPASAQAELRGLAQPFGKSVNLHGPFSIICRSFEGYEYWIICIPENASHVIKQLYNDKTHLQILHSLKLPIVTT